MWDWLSSCASSATYNIPERLKTMELPTHHLGRQATLACFVRGPSPGSPGLAHSFPEPSEPYYGEELRTQEARSLTQSHPKGGRAKIHGEAFLILYQTTCHSGQCSVPASQANLPSKIEKFLECYINEQQTLITDVMIWRAPTRISALTLPVQSLTLPVLMGGSDILPLV